MAEEATKKAPVDKTNWADMDHDDDDDQEIGVQGAHDKNDEEKKEVANASSGDQQNAAEGDKPAYNKRPRKDYGDKYDPNYKKKIWSKGGYSKPEGVERKNIAPAIVRNKNERGDYVVTSFSIPDAAEKLKAAAEKRAIEEGAEKVTKKRRVGAFQVDSSDEEEQQETSDVEDEEETKQEEAKPVIAATQEQQQQKKSLSKKEQKKKDLEELEALLGSTATPATETKPATQAPATTAAAEGESKKKKKHKNKKEGEAAEEKPAATEEKKDVVEAELTPEQKAAALAEALKKRNAQKSTATGAKSAATLAAQIEKAERKQKGGKKGKGEDYDR